MSVYVDNADIPYRRMLMSHLWADTLDELFEMVDVIGVQRKWLQRPEGVKLLSGGHWGYHAGMPASWVHFDIAKNKKQLAMNRGAILTDRLGPLLGSAQQLLGYPDPQMQERGRKQYQRVMTARMGFDVVDIVRVRSRKNG